MSNTNDNINSTELTAEERESLLRGPATAEPGGSFSAGTAAIATDADESLPTTVGNQVAGALINIYRDFAMRLAAQFTERLRCETLITDVQLSQPSYGEFIFSLQHPTCLHVIDEPACETPWLLELHPEILFPLIDRLLGGGKLPVTRIRRPLTEIETRLVSRITSDILRDFRTSWRPVNSWHPDLNRIEANPKLVREAHPGHPMVVVEMSIEFAGNRGPLRIAMATTDLLAIREEILNPPGPPADQVAMSIALAETTIPESELENLAVGDIIPTNTSPDQLATVYIDGQPKYLGRPGTSRGRKAVRIESTIEE